MVIPNRIVDVYESGAVCLGKSVVCDGFADDCQYRVQTHIHEDHMSGFSTSKGRQQIYLSPETYALLIDEKNADLEYRQNLHPIERGDITELGDGSILEMLPSNHMLGACQVSLKLVDGCSIGYSGDFGWPIEQVIQVDQLVIDSSYGSPRSIRQYTQSQAEASLLEIVSTRLRHGSVHIKAHIGTIERALQVLGGSVGVPIIATERLIKRIAVYQRYGNVPGNLTELESDDGKHAQNNRSYVRLYSKGDGFLNELTEGTSVTCSAYMVNGVDPMLKYSDRAYSVALSNHADFEDTIEYVAATGATTVVTDNTRNHGCDLANAIRERFPSIHVQPSSNKPVWY